MSVDTQNATIRNLLARLDIAIIDLEKEQLRAIEIENAARDHAAALDEIKARLMVVRDELHPILDSSAPRKFPYDSRVGDTTL